MNPLATIRLGQTVAIRTGVDHGKHEGGCLSAGVMTALDNRAGFVLVQDLLDRKFSPHRLRKAFWLVCLP